jgi:hypothetical protein
MSENYRSILNVLSTPLLLDTYGGSAVAYSLRKLSSTYSGSAIRVRRSSDNAEQDINFVGGDLDTQSLLDFVGYNLLTYSEDFTIATPVWNKFQTTITGDVETAPDGTLTGDKLVESAVNGYHYLDRTNYAITNGLDYNISIYLKQGERTLVRIASAISGTNTACDIDLTNGTISNSTFTNTPVITAEANGWYRFSVTITSGTTSAVPLIRVFPYNASNQLIYTGDGTSGCYVWGAQLTQTSDVRNYTKTGATANAGNGFVTTWYDQSGNANNATQSTAQVQPQIVSSGTILTNNSKPSIFLENQDSLTFTSLTPITTFTVAKIDTLNYAIHYVLYNNVSPRGYFYGGTFTGVNGLGIYDGTAKSITGEDTNTHLGYFNYNGTNYEVAKDGDTISNLASGSNFDLNYIGRQQTSLSLNGQLQEIVIYPSTQSTNKSNIESNINTYYSIY